MRRFLWAASALPLAAILSLPSLGWGQSGESSLFAPPPVQVTEDYGTQEVSFPASGDQTLQRRLAATEQQLEMMRVEMQQLREHTVSYDAQGNVIPAPAAKPQTPEEAQAAFNKMYDKAKGRFPNTTISGVFQADAGFFQQDANNRATVGNAVDGADFRRVRLGAKGAVTETVEYFIQMDFGFFGRPTFTDVWLEQKELPLLGNWRIGQWKQPFSLEVVSSFRYTTFMERSLLFQTFDPFRHIGTGLYDYDHENLAYTWAVSGFRTGQDQFGNSASNGGGWGFCERVTWCPWYDEDSGGRGFLHLGAGHFFSEPPNKSFNFRTIPELFIGQSDNTSNPNQQPVPTTVTGTPFFIQTGTLPINQYNVFGLEKLYVNGAFSWQTEAQLNVVNLTTGNSIQLPGAYTQVGWFLTGEHRPYDRKTGTIDRVMPFENFFIVGTDGGRCTGWGAWEVAARYSFLDFTQANGLVPTAAGTPANGGTLQDATLGLNWYWNPYTKMVFNAVHSFLDNPATGRSDSTGYAMRAQIDF
jgi:phosphate-selective porin OprO/OprP